VFWREWGRLFALGDSRWDLARRVVAALIAVGLIPALPTITATVGVQGSKTAGAVTLPAGLLVSAAALVFWGAMTGSLAWLLTRGPRLRVADPLEVDVSARCFRLRIYNDSAVRCRPKVSLMRVWDTDSEVELLDPAQAPLELQWTHQQPGVRAELSRQEYRGESVGVFLIDAVPKVAGAPQNLIAYGAFHQPALGAVKDLAGRTIFVFISVTLPEFPGRKEDIEILAIDGDASAPLGFTPQGWGLKS
jgi:hypothetical protein